MVSNAHQCASASATILIEERTLYGGHANTFIGGAQHSITIDAATCQVTDAVSYGDFIHGMFLSYDHTDLCAAIVSTPPAFTLQKCTARPDVDIIADTINTLVQSTR